MWEKDVSSTGPEQAYHIAYHSTRNSLENVIGTWRSALPGDAVNPSGVITIASEGTGHKILGSIAYVRSGDIFQANKLVTTDWNRAADVPTLIKDTVAYTAQSSKRPFLLHDRPCSNCRLENTTEIGGKASTIGRLWTVMNRVNVNTIAQAPNIWNGTSKQGARVCKRYKDGVLTTEPLWPWPMNQRIINAMVRAGKNPVDVTATMETIFGPIPSVCKNGSTSLAPMPPLAPTGLPVSP
jgi:hypothetical protein